MSRLDALRVYECTLPLVRLGRDGDGGYVIADGLQYDHFLSGGIGDDNSFELSALELNPMLVCEAFDPASDGAKPHERHRFHREKLGYAGLGYCRDALVKIDVEGDEWPWLVGLGPWQLTHIAQLVIELHSPHRDRWDWGYLAWLASTHALIHAHANNMDGIVTIDGVKVPATIECTFVRRDLAGDVSPSRKRIPSSLDQPNDPKIPDHAIDWEPFVHKPFDDMEVPGGDVA